MDIEVNGRMHALARKIGKIGGEHIVFAITTRDLELWQKLVGVTEGEVTLTISAAQQEMPLEPAKPDGNGLPAGVKEGSAAASGAHQAAD